MRALRGTTAFILICTILLTPTWGTSDAAFGTVVNAERAGIGTGPVSVGSTVYGGDRLYTDAAGSVQVRAGAARLLLSGASAAVLAKEQTIPAASLTRGTAIFSTATSKAFLLRVGKMDIRPETDQPTVAQVTVIGPKELLVRSTKGSVTVAVEDDVRSIPEGMAYRINLEPTDAELASAEATAQGPAGVGAGRARSPRRAGRSRFIWFAIAVPVIITSIALWKALESDDRPNH